MKPAMTSYLGHVTEETKLINKSEVQDFWKWEKWSETLRMSKYVLETLIYIFILIHIDIPLN